MLLSSRSELEQATKMEGLPFVLQLECVWFEDMKDTGLYAVSMLTFKNLWQLVQYNRLYIFCNAPLCSSGSSTFRVFSSLCLRYQLSAVLNAVATAQRWLGAWLLPLAASKMQMRTCAHIHARTHFHTLTHTPSALSLGTLRPMEKKLCPSLMR